MEPALPKGTLFENRYEILGELGSGSFGRVYHARQLSIGQPVAIKLLSPREGTDESSGREAERFRRETQICAALHHTNIVRRVSVQLQVHPNDRAGLSEPGIHAAMATIGDIEPPSCRGPLAVGRTAESRR